MDNQWKMENGQWKIHWQMVDGKWKIYIYVFRGLSATICKGN